MPTSRRTFMQAVAAVSAALLAPFKLTAEASPPPEVSTPCECECNPLEFTISECSVAYDGWWVSLPPCQHCGAGDFYVKGQDLPSLPAMLACPNCWRLREVFPPFNVSYQFTAPRTGESPPTTGWTLA